MKKESDQFKTLLTSFKQIVAGGMGGICLVFAGHPMDTIKVQMQTMPTPKNGEPPRYTSTLDCVKKTIKAEGFRGFYKGVVAPLIGATPINSVIFFGYGLGVTLQTGGSPTDVQNLTYSQILLAGMVSGSCASMINAPAERIKCLLQVQNPKDSNPQYRGFWDCTQKVYRRGGIPGLYKGLFVTLIRDIPSSAAYFAAYEWLKKNSATYLPMENQAAITLWSGGMAGIAFWVVGIPADVVKSKYQTAPSAKYNGVLDVCRSLFANNGISGFYRGALPVFLRAFPANAACFVGYEYTMQFLNTIL